MVTLILGGARSGKSAHAEMLAAATGKDTLYIATAHAGDDEMAARITRHRQQRNDAWTTIEEPRALGAAILQSSTPKRVVLVDCLTVWLSNLLFAENHTFPEVGVIVPPACFNEERAALLDALGTLAQSANTVILVSNEVGTGLVAQSAVSRWFVDEAGRLNQDVAALCNRVQLVVAGLPLTLKGRECSPA